MILKKLFGFDPSVMKVRTEIMAGVTTFLTMSYILAVNPDILSAASMDRGAVFTATALAASLATLVMAILAKLPFALAPGMGLNAFFAFTLVQGMGYSWESALAAVFIEGLVFILLTVFNIRELIVNAIPETLRHAISVGIGLFIAFLGLQKAGLIVANPATFVSLVDVVGRGRNYYWGSVGCTESERSSFLCDRGGHVIKYSFGDYPDTGRLFFSIDASFSGAGLFQAGFSFFVVPEYVDRDFLTRVHGYF